MDSVCVNLPLVSISILMALAWMILEEDRCDCYHIWRGGFEAAHQYPSSSGIVTEKSLNSTGVYEAGVHHTPMPYPVWGFFYQRVNLLESRIWMYL